MAAAASRLLRAAALLSLLAAAALWLVRDAGAWALGLVVAALFLANGAFTPIAETLVLRHLHGADGLDARRYGRVRLWGSVGFIVSVLLFGVVLQRTGIQALPLLTLGVFALLAWVTWRLPRQLEPPAAAQARAAVWPVLRQPVVRWFFAGVMLTVLAHSSLYAFLSLYLDQQGYGKAAVGAMWAVAVAAEIAFFALAGRRFERIDPYRWLVWAALASVLRFALTAAFGGHAALLVVAQLMHALTFAAQHMACTTLDRQPLSGPAARTRLGAVLDAGLRRAGRGRRPGRRAAEPALRAGGRVLGRRGVRRGERRLLRDGARATGGHTHNPPP